MSIVLREATHTSRGKVQCDDCLTTIPAGARYHGTVSTGDGRVWTWRECEPCADLVPDVTADLLSDDDYGTDTFEAWASDNPDDPRAVAYLARRFAAAGLTEGSTTDAALTPAATALGLEET